MFTELWAHIASGERYVVVVNEDGDVIEACGPLHYSEIDAAIRDGFDSDSDLVNELNANADNYRSAPGDKPGASKEHSNE